MIENDVPATAITDPALFADDTKLHGMLARLRRSDPFPYVKAEGHSPFWLATRHATITAIELDPKRFISAPRQALFSLAHIEKSRALAGDKPPAERMRNVTGMDGEDHRVYRAIAQSHFMSKALNAIRDDIDAIACEFVGRMVAKGDTCDFAGDIALGYPLRVIMSILGVAPEDEALMLRFTQQLLTSQDPEFNDAEANPLKAMSEMFLYFQPIIADRRAKPRDDIASVIANAKVDGAYLADRDVFGYFLIIATAGHDTTSYSLTGGLLALLENPEQLGKLRADPALLPTAIDEFIRWTSPVKHFTRTCTEDCIIDGKQIRKDDIVVLSYPSANRDEAIFDDPFVFRVDRKPNRHLAFGTGPHLCLGQHLAKMELSAFLREFLTRIDHLELAGEPRRVQSTFVGGVKRLPIRYRFR
ncbi:cytochrome P450 [Sphingomonas sp. SUN039]|uniref:cytochrome P450 n=1 Tax=Sphingomonas sp. SUN039 TaxID=2937787 RepID=UPI0021641B5B|nr:cytochrome P450 [Sphingomonas sp. SUN039]UVO53672.1 cytochrome P450 [Sphingomonas sp. SUN039]